MSGKGIYLFMWSYQDSYRITIQILVRSVLASLGAPEDAEVFLVGARSPNNNNHNPVCIEPEDGIWELSLFDGLLDSIESTYRVHDAHNLFYSDETSMRDKPEWVRCDSVRKSVQRSLDVYDKKNDVTSFCGEVRNLDGYYISTVIQIPNTTFQKHPPLPFREGEQINGHRSLIHAAINAVLHEATEELQHPNPGKNSFYSMRKPEEIIRIAAQNFMYTPGGAIEKGYMFNDLFTSLNLISSLMYEGNRGVGQLILVNPDNDAIEFLIKFEESISFRETRWVRKVLQMASTGIGIIADSQYIYGLGRLKESHDPSMQDAFIIEFIDHYLWELRCGEQALLRSHYAEPKLPQEPFDKITFLANYTRLFPLSTKKDGINLWNLMLIQINQGHGSMIVVAEDAEDEALRLSKQGTRIKPIPLSGALLNSVSCIDGTILLSPDGYCHAVGIILDGEATEQCTPSRGSRYNSGVRYVQPNGPKRLAIVVSDDKTIDIIPQLRKLVYRSKIEKYLAMFEASTIDNYHDSRNWLDKHRFYINAEQCARINRKIDYIEAHPKEVGIIHLCTEHFEVHPEMNSSYLID